MPAARSSTRNSGTGPVVNSRWSRSPGPKTSSCDVLGIRLHAKSGLMRFTSMPRTSSKNWTVSSKASVRVPTQTTPRTFTVALPIPPISRDCRRARPLRDTLRSLADAPLVRPRRPSEGTPVNAIRQSVVLPWIIAVIGFPIGGFLGHLVAGPAATVPAAALSGLIAGIIVGLAQALALGLSPRVMSAWVAVTGIGLAAGLSILTAATGQIESTAEAVALGAVSGLAIGAAQA